MEDASYKTVADVRIALAGEVSEYRFAGAWRYGTPVGEYLGAVEDPLIVVMPGLQDRALAYRCTPGNASAVRFWGKWSEADVGHFVLVHPSGIRRRLDQARPYMSRTPHRCQRCGKPALIMAVQVHCTNTLCANYDPKA